MVKKEYKISGMNCGHCVKAVNIELSALKLTSFDVSVGKAVVEFDPSAVSEIEIIKAIEEAGYKVEK